MSALMVGVFVIAVLMFGYLAYRMAGR